MKVLRISILILLLALPWRLAHALVFTEFGALSITSPSLQKSQDPTYSRVIGLSWGGGISLGFRILENIDFEPGLLYIGQSFNTTGTGVPRTGYTFWSAQIPIILRYWLNPKFSLGGGFYYSRGIGSVSVNQGNNSIYMAFPDLGWSTNDAGLTLSVRYRSPMTELVSFVIDGRALIGFRNFDISGTSSSFYTRTLQFWTGIAFIL